MPLDLSPRQQKAVAAGLTVVAGAVILAAIAFVVWLLSLFLRTFSSVFLPLAVAGVGALVVRPYYHWLRERVHLPPGVGVAAVFVSFGLPLLILTTFFGAVLVQQVSDLVRQVPAWWDDVRAWATERIPVLADLAERWGLQERLSAALEGGGSEIVAGLGTVGGRALDVGAGIVGFFGSLFGWAIVPVYFAFFLLLPAPEEDGEEAIADKLLPFLKAETRADVVYLVNEFIEIVVAFFRGQLVVALLQGLLFATGFALVGLRYGFVLGLLLGFLNIVPYLGSIVGLGVCLPLAFFQNGGGWATVAWVLAVFAAVQAIEGYLLTPRIMGERTGLHPMAIIFSIFFWGAALQGILGMVLAIPLTAFLVVFWRLAREKYISELV